MAVFQLPVVLKYSALKPMAVLEMPVLFKSASSPKTVLSLVKQPSWQVAHACAESAKQAEESTRAGSSLATVSRYKDERQIELFLGDVFVLINAAFLFPRFVNCACGRSAR